MASNFTETDIVRQHISAASGYVGQQSADAFSRMSHALISQRVVKVESPLEALFCVWWWAYMKQMFQSDCLDLECQQDVCVSGQTFRLDFAITPASPKFDHLLAKWKPIAVELDGHEFHERTKEQVQLRDRRDRALQLAGWQVLHYSFSEFTDAPLDVVSSIVLIALNQMADIHEEVKGLAKNRSVFRAIQGATVDSFPRNIELSHPLQLTD